MWLLYTWYLARVLVLARPLICYVYGRPGLSLATRMGGLASHSLRMERLATPGTYGCLGLSLATYERPEISLATCGCLGLSLATYGAPDTSFPA